MQITMSALFHSAGFGDRPQGVTGEVKRNNEVMTHHSLHGFKTQSKFSAGAQIVEQNPRHFTEHGAGSGTDTHCRPCGKPINARYDRNNFAVGRAQLTRRGKNEIDLVAYAAHGQKPIRRAQGGKHDRRIIEAVAVESDFPLADELALLRCLATLARQNQTQNRSGNNCGSAHGAFPFPRKTIPHHARLSFPTASPALPAFSKAPKIGPIAADPAGGMDMPVLPAVFSFERQARSALLGFMLGLASIALAVGSGLAIGIFFEALQ